METTTVTGGCACEVTKKIPPWMFAGPLMLVEDDDHSDEGAVTTADAMDMAWPCLEDELYRVDRASSKTIASLHQPRVGETAERSCSVCVKNFQEGDKLRMMPCSHTFHQLCIFRVLSVNRFCPVCRFALPSPKEQCALDDRVAGGAS